MLTGTMVNTVADVEFPVTDSYAALTPAGMDSLSNHGAPNTHIIVTAASAVPYQGVEPDAERMSYLLGRVIAVRPNRFRTSWYLPDSGMTLGLYLDGPALNPTPVNGRHYREFLPDEPMRTRAPYVLRYNDDAHINDRLAPDNPWTIVRGGNMLSPFDDREVQRYTEPRMYVEIQWPAPVAGATDEEIDSILSTPDEEEQPWGVATAPVLIEGAPIARTRGVGAVEESGVVQLDPPLVPGQAYLVWDTDRDYYDVRTPAGFLMDDGETISLVGYYAGTGTDVRWMDDLYQGEIATTLTSVHWAKVAAQTHTENAEESDAKVAALLAQREAEFNAFERLNSRLNDLAEEQSWCGEYEAAMGRIGMRSRRGSAALQFDPRVASVTVPDRHAWNIEVDVNFSGEIDYIRGGLEGEIENAASFNGSVSSVRFDASVRVTVTGIVADDEDSARSQIDNDTVESAMDDAGVSYSDIEHWTVDDVNEDDDFDWEDYDDNN